MIVITCFSTSIAFQSLLINFKSNCVSNASIAFKYAPIDDKTNDTQTMDKFKRDEHFKEFQSFHIDPITQRPIGEEVTHHKKHIYEFLEKEKQLPVSTTTEMIKTNKTDEDKKSKQVHFLHPDDVEFFNNCK